MNTGDHSQTEALAELERVLPQLAHAYPAELLPRLRQVVTANIQRGRWVRVQAQNPAETLAHYVQVVATNLQTETHRHGSLTANNDAAWAELHKLLRARAYQRLCKLGRATPAEAWARAEDLAQRACLAILEAQPYPYDVPYLAWASRILYNAIQAETSRSRDMLDHHDRLTPDDTDAAEDETIPDPQTQDQSERLEAQVDMQWALAQLPSTERRLIEHKLAHDLSDEDLAAELNITVQAVYNRRNRARKHLTALLKKK